jgi:hypothetical protein
MSNKEHVQLRVLPGGALDPEQSDLEYDGEPNVFDFPVEAIFSSAEALLAHWFKSIQPQEKDIPFWKETAYNDALVVLQSLKDGGYLK